MQDGHLGRIKTERHRFELTANDTRPVHSALYHTDPIAWQHDAKGIPKMLQENVVEPASIERASPILFTPKMAQ